MTVNIGNLGTFRTAQESRAIKVGCWLKPRVVGPARDTDYRGLPDDVLADILRVARQKDPAWVAERFDCNKFAVCWMADVLRWWGFNAECGEALDVGFAWLRWQGSKQTHELCYAVNNQDEVRLWEPQTNLMVLDREVAECFEMWE